jgi:hypothetical protein
MSTKGNLRNLVEKSRQIAEINEEIRKLMALRRPGMSVEEIEEIQKKLKALKLKKKSLEHTRKNKHSGTGNVRNTRRNTKPINQTMYNEVIKDSEDKPINTGDKVVHVREKICMNYYDATVIGFTFSNSDGTMVKVRCGAEIKKFHPNDLIVIERKPTIRFADEVTEHSEPRPVKPIEAMSAPEIISYKPIEISSAVSTNAASEIAANQPVNNDAATVVAEPEVTSTQPVNNDAATVVVEPEVASNQSTNNDAVTVVAEPEVASNQSTNNDAVTVVAEPEVASNYPVNNDTATVAAEPEVASNYPVNNDTATVAAEPEVAETILEEEPADISDIETVHGARNTTPTNLSIKRLSLEQYKVLKNKHIPVVIQSNNKVEAINGYACEYLFDNLDHLDESNRALTKMIYLQPNDAFDNNIQNVLPEQISFIVFFNEIFTSAIVNGAASSVKVSSSFSHKFKIVQGYLEKIGLMYGNEDELKLYWDHLQTKYVKHNKRIITYNNIKGAIIADPKHIQRYFEEGLRFFHGEDISDEKRFFRQLTGSASHYPQANNGNSLMSESSEHTK